MPDECHADASRSIDCQPKNARSAPDCRPIPKPNDSTSRRRSSGSLWPSAPSKTAMVSDPPMATRKHESGPPMDLANMRAQGVRSLAVYCLNQRCLHRAVFNVDSYSGTVLVQSFGPKMVCEKCGTIGADARPNWSEISGTVAHRRPRPPCQPVRPNGPLAHRY